MEAVKEGQNKYCGPAVLSILTGRSTDECAGIISSINGHYDVREVQVVDLIKAAKKLRFLVTKVDADCSLFSLFHQIVHKNGMYLVVIKKHVVAIEVNDTQVFLCDNHTKEPINGASSARLSQRVLECYSVISKPEPKFISCGYVINVVKHYSNQSSIGVSIRKYEEYEDSEDNIIQNLGYFTAKDEAELKAVRDELLRTL